VSAEDQLIQLFFNVLLLLVVTFLTWKLHKNQQLCLLFIF